MDERRKCIRQSVGQSTSCAGKDGRRGRFLDGGRSHRASQEARNSRKASPFAPLTPSCSICLTRSEPPTNPMTAFSLSFFRVERTSGEAVCSCGKREGQGGREGEVEVEEARIMYIHRGNVARKKATRSASLPS